MLLYRLLRPLFFALPAELAHELTFAALRVAFAVPGVRWLADRLFVPHDPDLAVEALGRVFPHPLGLAAGFDKDARGFEALTGLGFAYVEVGTLTAYPQAGNDKPRLFRLPLDRALLNRLGFNNRGSADAVARLAKPRRCLVGVNVGKSKITPEEEASEDYALSVRRLAAYADYLVVNVSSPNTPGLRNLQAVDKLRPLLDRVREEAEEAAGACPPLLVKIAPDLSDGDIDAVADLALDLRLDGIVATNTTVSRAGLGTPGVDGLGAGGISGAPLKERSLDVLRRLRARVGERLVLVSVGGIEDADDAWARIRAGASLLQLYTGFVYGGPTTARRIALGVLERARQEGFGRVQDAIGSAVAEET